MPFPPIPLVSLPCLFITQPYTSSRSTHIVRLGGTPPYLTSRRTTNRCTSLYSRTPLVRIVLHCTNYHSYFEWHAFTLLSLLPSTCPGYLTSMHCPHGHKRLFFLLPNRRPAQLRKRRESLSAMRQWVRLAYREGRGGASFRLT